MGDTVRAAVIGAGIWGQNHALVYNDYHRSELKAVCDLDPSRGKEVADRFGCHFTTDIESIAHDQEIDTVSVTTPDHAHYDPVMTMVKAGKNVIVEKPFTTDVEQAIQLYDAASQWDKKFMVDFQMRWNPSYMVVKEAILQGELGKPHMGYARLSDAIDVAENWLTWSAQSGPHWFLFPHTMDIMRWCFDQEPVEVYAAGSRGVLADRGIDTFDAIQAQVRFSDGAFATFETSWIVPNSSPSVIDAYFSLYGTEGKVELDGDYSGIALASDKFKYPWAPVGKRNLYGKLDHRIYEPIKYFVDCVYEDNEPVSTFYDGLVNTIMIDATLQSIEAGKPIPISLPG
jgi:predicted dehydrogenase